MTAIALAKTPIPGMYVATSRGIHDDRGAFARLFCNEALAPAQAGRPIVQINHSRTRHAGTVRGLHYQRPPHAEGKWVRCLRGQVYDVGVDVRVGSPTYLDHHAVVLDAAVGNAVFLPEGVAHGFQALTDDAELLYLHTAAYAPDHERGLRADDPALAIAWPRPMRGLSERDRAHPLIDPSFEGLPC
jgi:dTDP-4-dehydrorhamnose 3,5-epimerase